MKQLVTFKIHDGGQEYESFGIYNHKYSDVRIIEDFFSIENNVLTTNGSKINIYERNNQLMQLVEKTSDPI